MGVSAAQAQDDGADDLSALPYTYPFGDAATTDQLTKTPMVVELYTSLDCIFCPRAERLLNDMIQKTRVIGVACHVDDEGPAYPLARSFCSDRQEQAAARLTDGLLYTPQMIINGHIDAVGHEFDDVREGLKQARTDKIIRIEPRTSPTPGIYLVDLPETKLDRAVDLTLITYWPSYQIPKNQRQSLARPDPLLHVAQNLASLGSWKGQARTLSISFMPSADAIGFIVLAQKEMGDIIAVAEKSFPLPQTTP